MDKNNHYIDTETETKKNIAQKKIVDYARSSYLNYFSIMRILNYFQIAESEEKFKAMYADYPEKAEIAQAVIDLRGEE